MVLKPRWQPCVIHGLIYPYIVTHDAPAWNPGPCCILCRQNIYFRTRKCNFGGDFNCPLNPVLNKKGGILLPRKSVVGTIDCLCADIWRVKNPCRKSYTWSQNSPMILCRLDFWLISHNLQDLVTTTDIIPAITTDHAAISIEFSISKKQVKGQAIGEWTVRFWMTTVRDVTTKIPIWLIEGQKELTDDRSIWDWTKYKIRAHAIQHSKWEAMERKAKQLFDSDIRGPVSATCVCVYFFIFLARLFCLKRDSCFHLCQRHDFFYSASLFFSRYWKQQRSFITVLS